MPPAATLSCRLRELLAARGTLIMPDAYDAISARLIVHAGFSAIQCSGYSMSVALGLPDEDQLSRADNLDLTASIIRNASVPVMADGEDGYGNREAVGETIAALVNLGAAGANLEDQRLRTGRPGVEVVSPEDMLDKLDAARQAARAAGNPQFVLNARTDALRAHPERAAGLEEAARRASLYLSAGADLAFVTGVKTLAEASHLCATIPGPVSIAAGLPYNVRSLPLDGLVAIGVARVSLPWLVLGAALGAAHTTLVALQERSEIGQRSAPEPFISEAILAELLEPIGALTR